MRNMLLGVLLVGAGLLVTGCESIKVTKGEKVTGADGQQYTHYHTDVESYPVCAGSCLTK